MTTTPTLRDAAQALLSALAFRDAAVFSGDRDKVKFGADKVYEAVDELRAALTQGAGAVEPVAWMDDGSTRNGSDGQEFRVVTARTKAGMPRAAAQAYTTPLYPAPPAQQLQQAVARALAEQREQLAQGWDGCMYDAVGETIDIGADIRAKGTHD